MFRLRSLTTAIAVAATVAMPVIAGSPAAAATPTPVRHCPTVITQASSNRTVSLVLGKCAQLKLSGLVWSTPTVSGTSVRVVKVPVVAALSTTSTTVAPPSVTYDVLTEHTGKSTITSTGRPKCQPAMACPLFIELFRVTIDVVPPTPG